MSKLSTQFCKIHKVVLDTAGKCWKCEQISGLDYKEPSIRTDQLCKDTEFVKRVRLNIPNWHKVLADSEDCRIRTATEWLLGACDIIERQEKCFKDAAKMASCIEAQQILIGGHEAVKTILQARIKKMYSGDLSPENRLNGYSVLLKNRNNRIEELQARIDEQAFEIKTRKAADEMMQARIEELEGDKAKAEVLNEFYVEGLNKSQAEIAELKPKPLLVRTIGSFKIIINEEVPEGQIWFATDEQLKRALEYSAKQIEQALKGE